MTERRWHYADDPYMRTVSGPQTSPGWRPNWFERLLMWLSRWSF